MAPVRCLVCGATHAVCGPATGAVQPIDTPALKEHSVMAELHRYTTVVNGIETTLRLTEADAKKRGLTKQSAGTVKATAAPVTSKTVTGK